MYLATLALELLLEVALATLSGTGWAHHGPTYISWGLYLAVHFPKLALELLLGVASETMAGTIWAEHKVK